MAVAPKLTMINVTNSTGFTPSLFAMLQQNIQNYGLLFLPLSGGVMNGTIQFAPGQTFAASGVAIPNPTYPHANVHQTILDHVNDPTIHVVPGLPLVHAFTHGASGADPVYGDQIGISSGIPGKTVKSYIDSSIATASAAAFSNFAGSAYYEIGGIDPIYGNLTPISAASGSTDIKSYVDNSLASALSGGVPANPTFQSITMGSTGQLLFTSSAYIGASGGPVLKTSGNNLVLQAPSAIGSITVGSASGTFGNFTTGGYSIGSSSLGASGASINGPLVAGYDINLSRSASALPAQAQINFGPSNALARLSWNVDVPGSFAFSQGLQIAGPLTLQASNALSIAGEFYLGTVASNSTAPGIRTDGTNAYLYAKETGYISLGYDNVSLQKISLGPAGAWAYFDSIGIHIGSSTIAASGTTLAGSLILNNATAASAGDLGLARTTTSGLIGFGRTAATLDYGVTSAGILTFAVGGTTANQIRADGTYLTGSSTYGPGSAVVNGQIKATSILSGSGSLTNGYSFNGGTNTGLFSSSVNSLTLGVSGVSAINLSPTTATISVPTTINAALIANTLSSSGQVFNGTTVLTGPMLAGGSTITKYRVKTALPLGYNAGAVATTGANSVYPNTVVINYAGATIDAIRLACLTPDTTGTATTVNILRNGSVIGYISLPNGGQTAVSYTIVNPQPIVAGDVLQAVITAAGTATGLYIVLEISEYLI